MPQVTFYDCTPSYADIFTNAIKRPEEIGADSLKTLTGDPPTLLYKRITETHGQIQALAEKDQQPEFFQEKAAELREHNPGAPILIAGGRYLFAPNIDATSAAVMDVTSTAERSAWIEHHAQKIVEAFGYLKGSSLLPLAKDLQAKTGCSIPKGKQHLAKAFRRLRGQSVRESQRGGAREGAGRPTKEG